MTGNPHRILRQVLELDLASAGRAPELQEAVAQPFRDPPLPELEELFDRFAGPGEVLRLDRLELDLGELTGEGWEELFRHRLLRRLQQALEDAAAEALRAPTAEAAVALEEVSGVRFRQLLFFLAHGRLPWWGGRPRRAWDEVASEGLAAAERRALGELLGRDSRARQRLVHTVGDGFLAALVAALGGLEQASRVLAFTAPPGLSPGLERRWRERFWTLVLEVAAAGAGAERGRRLMRRLVAERTSLAATIPGAAAGAEDRPRLADAAAPEDGGAIRRRPPVAGDGAAEMPLPPLPQPWQGWLESATRDRRRAAPAVGAPDPRPAGGEEAAEMPLPPLPSPRPGRAEAAAREIPLSPLPPSSPGGPEAAARDRRRVAEARGRRPLRPPSASEPGDTEPRAGPAAASGGEDRRRRAPAAAGDAAGTGPAPAVHQGGPPPGAGPVPAPWAALEPHPDPLRPAAGGEKPPAILADDEAIYLEGAGAVILHPFLEELFAGRALLRRRDFRRRSARCRGVHLAGYLTFGSEGVPEYDLVLAKLLCGLPWEEPLPPGELDDAERTACGELLAAVLRHWQALRSASPDWLRQQFFLRQGKLERVDQGFKLTVERRAQDVLLDKLPWGVGLIRLPWMRDFLHVRWTT